MPTVLRAGADESTGLSVAERWTHFSDAVEQLSSARTLDAVVALLRRHARRIVGADGIAIILRDNDKCHYVAEDAKAPLWAGQKFPAETCVSGWAMIHNETAIIPDVQADPRVPFEAYRPTFVRSMAMVPIGRPEPVAAMGAYWSETGDPSANEIALLEALARSAATAIENMRLIGSLETLNANLGQRVAERTAELEKAQEILRQTQKMEVIGQLTGNVAHDFNNLLSPIMASLDLILIRANGDERLQRSATVAMDAAERAKTLIQRLLAFARRQPLSTKPVGLDKLTENMSSLLASTVGQRIELRIDCAGGLPPVRIDEHQLEMAVLNLVVNARDAMGDGGRLVLSVRLPGLGEPRPANLPAGDFVRLAVTDTDSGMDAHTLKNAIEPFFSTKTSGQGTGLGLSMVHGLMGQLGGGLELHSKPGKGTEVALWLPVAKTAIETPEAEPDVEGEASPGSVLIVDDEPIVRSGTADMLEDLGYKVVQAENARQAIDLIEGGFVPSLVITDHIMPGMTGAEFALRLRVEHPDTAILIISGYQGIDLIAPDIVRLSKPFRQIHLVASIAAARDQVAA
ncbi:GAF domain-containing hybrid sensor histidine kinase/response regulator [Sphingomonas montanisoli]|uniref:histidine kinase n=1 Tax=Sphingomonas montanisoli TaxID=2606412 RepID=A0A5D9CAN9_9SPHN|nr:ATP-binding protein [Sphingomonas montanisoli]TZG29008.1 response regulator [Sphingomonas montanisoli]